MLRARSALPAVLALALTAAASVASFAQAPSAAPPPSAPPPPPAATAPPPNPNSDPFGEELVLPERTVVFIKGNGTWDSAFETLVDSFKSVQGFLQQQGIQPSGAALTIYTSTDDTGFQYQAAIPVAQPPANPPRGDIEVGKSPSGKVLKFVHRGSYDSMDTTYEAITNHLDSKQLEAQDTFFEEYVTDPLTTPEDKLIINVYVPIKP